MTTPSWTILTPRSHPGPVGVIQFRGNPREVFERTGVRPVGPGRMGLRDLCGVDEGVVAHWPEGPLQFMPHGGPAVLRRLAAALEQAGLEHAEQVDPMALYPEAGDLTEARMLHALAVAPSRLAIDLLLDQPARWAEPGATADPAIDRLRHRLLRPPLIVGVGPPNVGKSTLLNALAGRGVASVADQPGTTRDHVGAMLDLGGLMVRYADTPGFEDGLPGRARADAPVAEREAARLAGDLIERADLVLRCIDAGGPLPAGDLPEGPAVLTVALRTDLGRADFPHDAAVSAVRGEGLEALVATVRERLVPASALEDPSPWRFWEGITPSEEDGSPRPEPS